jgi:hypothetical protein
MKALAVVAASDLPKLRNVTRREYNIVIRDGKEEHRTRIVKSTNLKWGESFNL